MWMDETGKPDDQPAGFAAPDAAPLGPYSTTSIWPANQDAPAPADYAAAKDPGPSLDTVAPAPAATRDPLTPFEAGQEGQMASAGERDPREPFVTLTPLGAPDFAPPTGAPVTTGKWAPPTGSPVSAAGTAPTDPYAQRWASMNGGQAPATMYPTPGGSYPAPSPVRRGTAVVAEYRAADALGKLGVVMKALPWPILLILLAGLAIQQGFWAIWGICIAYLVCQANAKIAQTLLNRVFGGACVVYFVFWLADMVGNQTTWGTAVGDVSAGMGRWLCAILMVVTPVIVWRALENER